LCDSAGLRSPAHSRALSAPVLLVVATIIGVANAIELVGWRIINPLDLTWIYGDAEANQLGWEFLRRLDRLTFPPTYVEQLGYPFGVSISFLGSIPLVALILWPFRFVLPENFQYHGAFLAICSVLQAYYGIRLCRNLFGERPTFVWLGGTILLLAPAVTWRAFGHFPQCAHWLIIAAFSYYADDPVKTDLKKYFLPLFALAFLAGGIDPYLEFLVMLICQAAVLRLALRHYVRFCPALFLGLGLAAMGFFSLAIFGFLALGAGYSGLGYGMFSMNLLAPIDPHVYASILLKAQSIGPGQYEGYNYLGLGVILMLLIGLARKPGVLGAIFRPDCFPLLLVFAVCTVLALSTKAMIGPVVLYDLQAGRITDLLSTMRASGRLFWPAHYLLILAALVLVYRSFARSSGTWLLGTLFIVQIADTLFFASSSRERLARHRRHG